MADPGSRVVRDTTIEVFAVVVIRAALHFGHQPRAEVLTAAPSFVNALTQLG
jgi:hypothetical protein